jgi:hypothetical protein
MAVTTPHAKTQDFGEPFERVSRHFQTSSINVNLTPPAMVLSTFHHLHTTTTHITLLIIQPRLLGLVT